MNSNNLVILCFSTFLIGAIGTAVAVTVLSPAETTMEVLSNSSMYPGENFTVKLTSDSKPLANQAISVTFKGADGNVSTINLKTDEKGVATGIQNLDSGNYDVNISYSGNDDYKSSNITAKLEIKAKAILLDGGTHYSSDSYKVPQNMPLFRGDGPSDYCEVGEVGYDLSSGQYYRYLGGNNYELVD